MLADLGKLMAEDQPAHGAPDAARPARCSRRCSTGVDEVGRHREEQTHAYTRNGQSHAGRTRPSAPTRMAKVADHRGTADADQRDPRRHDSGTEGNLPTGHRTTVRTGLPPVVWRLLNQGVQPSKSTTAQIDEQAGMLEAWMRSGRRLCWLLNGNTGAVRLSEARAFLEAMNQEMAGTLFYGNGGVAPEEFTGLSVRYSSTDGAQRRQRDQGRRHAGRQHEHLARSPGTMTQSAASSPRAATRASSIRTTARRPSRWSPASPGARMRAMQERWQWKAGLCVRDWRYAVRICNIDLSDLAVSVPAGTSSLIIDAMERAIETLPSRIGQPRLLHEPHDQAAPSPASCARRSRPAAG